jgi:hypothetical protein
VRPVLTSAVSNVGAAKCFFSSASLALLPIKNFKVRCIPGFNVRCLAEHWAGCKKTTQQRRSLLFEPAKGKESKSRFPVDPQPQPQLDKPAAGQDFGVYLFHLFHFFLAPPALGSSKGLAIDIDSDVGEMSLCFGG